MSVGGRPAAHDPARPRTWTIAFLVSAALAVVAPARATSWVRAQELGALVEESRRAVMATVTAVQHGYDDRRLHTTFVTLRAEDRLFGEELPGIGQTFSIKVYGAPEPMTDGSRMFVEGTPRYRIGDRYLLLLLADSAWGFTNTAGLSRGAFRITTDDAGRLLAESLGGNRGVLGVGGLGRWITADEVEAGEAGDLRTTDGPVPYELLKRVIVGIRSGLLDSSGGER